MTHAATVGAKDEVSREAILALTTCNRGGAQACNPFADSRVVVDVPAYFNHGARKLMPEYDWGIVAKRVVKNVNIGSTDSAVGNLKLDLVIAATRFFDVL
jgi:hypothetical protein